MLTDETASLDEVAAALGRSKDWLMRNWLREHVKNGLPRKIASGWVWPRRAVEAWLRAGGAAPLPRFEPANENDGQGDLVAAAAASLMDRYGGRA